MNIVKILIIISGILSMSVITAQEQFSIEIEPLTIDEAPGLHSFSWARTSDGKWLVLGGRIDGLHQIQPFTAFPESSNNKNIFIIDPVNNQVWSSSVSALPTPVSEQLQSTNQQFHQRGNTLYVIGGYGFSPTQDDHITFPNLTAIDIDGLANTIISETDISAFFRQISNTVFAVTGGQLGYLDSTFYLCGGNYFEGRYNPQGPGSGPGFIQDYTDEIRKFEILDDGNDISIVNYIATNDPGNLHRRDYNMAPQIFPNGDHGFTMFSGVFQPDVDLPWLNSVDITDSGYTVNNDFYQYLSQYHSAKIPVYDMTGNAMHTFFFGGMSQYILDEFNNLVQDDNVPFVKTISKVTRLNDGSMTESKLDIEMPTLLGSGSEYIPLSDSNLYIDEEIIHLNNLPQNRTLVGYIYGGIESTLPNIFFNNDGTQSIASSKIFKVHITKNNATSIDNTNLQGLGKLSMLVYTNLNNDILNIDFDVSHKSDVVLRIFDVSGRVISKKIYREDEMIIGKNHISLSLDEVKYGTVLIISLETKSDRITQKLILIN